MVLITYHMQFVSLPVCLSLSVCLPGRTELVLDTGAPPAIPPNALLHFDVELVEIAKPGGWGGWLTRLAAIAKALPFR